jgi:hypothetical protein
MFAEDSPHQCHPEASEGPCIQHWMANGNYKTRVHEEIEVNTRSLGDLGMTVFCEGLSF